ncbi:MAG: ArsR family transcriptional regulator [Actinobacteria bacterium]|nr:ArsR family transcriptional regulator [Actinomycetota bacterium]MBU1493602.1 ArsR family transcriptional regulator [Actinomycetota bacterium]MBU1864806.1 ArsR family transcriptional regulator [Actinomycetota bacterium]
MTVTTPRVRDLTAADRRLRVDVAAGDAFEMLLSLFALGGEEEEADFEIGADWFEGIRLRAGDDLLARLSDLGDWSVWAALIGEAYAMGAPHTTERLLEHLEQMDPVKLRRGFLEVGACHASETVDPDDLDALAAGDAEAAAGAAEWCEMCPGLLRLIELPAAESRDTLVGLLRSFWEADPLPEGTIEALQQDAEHKRSLARRMEPERLVETATNGITVAVRPDLDEVVLVPTVVMRPWVIIAEWGGKRIFCYSVAEENLGHDGSKPPAWLVQFYKALGDERRLTIMRRLADGPASFGDLVELLDLAKSTVHHHIRQLRAAGVVRVTMGEDKEYSLRAGTAPEATRMLEDFLGIRAGDDQ